MSLGRNEIAMNNASSQNSQWFMTSPSGETRIVNVTENFVTVMTKRGYTFSRTDPTYTGTGRPITNFETLYPKQTQQLIKIGQDTTALGDIVTRQDATDAGFRTELDQALLGREANQANITSNTAKIEELFSSQQNIFDSIGQKADASHTHANGGGAEKCAWYDIGCQMQEGFEGLGKLALIGGVAVVGIWLLKMRLGK